MKVKVCVLAFLFSTLLMAPIVAQTNAAQQDTGSPLVKLLQAKGILTADEVASVSHASSSAEADQQLARLLLTKGLITEQDYAKTYGATPVAVSSPATVNAHLLPAVLRTTTHESTVASSGAPQVSSPPKEPPVIPAVAPLRVLPIDVPKQGGLIPDIKLGSGANLKIYGFFKASAIEDTANSGGSIFGNDDFPLPLLLGDTGPTSGPEFHLKARSFRMGTNFEWVGDPGFTVTGKLEYDFEGDFTNVNNRNISGVRSSTPGIRLAYARLDKKLGEVPWFAEFGQDWTILGSSTLPNLFESTGLGIGMGSFYERLPQFKTGFQFGSGSFKVQPEFAIVLSAAGTAALTDEQRTRFGDRAGSDSNQPGEQGRLVFQFPLNHEWKGVAPAQFIVSAGHTSFAEIVPVSNLPAGAVAGAVGCAKPLAAGGCSVGGFFPTGLQLNTPQNIWTTEIQLPTPWVTFDAKYYHGDDMRFYFSGQLNDIFNDFQGATVLPGGVANQALSFSNRAIQFGLLPGGQIIPAALDPVRGQGGFAELSFPLGRIFHADPAGRNAGWVWHMEYGTDRGNAGDVRRSGANGLVRTDLYDTSLQYKINKWVSFVNEVSYIDTRAATRNAKTFRGIPATTAHEIRNEFGTVFIF